MPQKTITTTPSEILARNPYRRSLIFHNPSANIIYVGRGQPNGLNVSTMSFRIPAGSTRTLNWFEDGKPAIQDQWSAFANTGSNTFEVDEFVGEGVAGSDTNSEQEAKKGA